MDIKINVIYFTLLFFLLIGVVTADSSIAETCNINQNYEFGYHVQGLKFIDCDEIGYSMQKSTLSCILNYSFNSNCLMGYGNNSINVLVENLILFYDGSLFEMYCCSISFSKTNKSISQWDQKKIKRKLYDVVDDETELNCISKEIMEYIIKLKNPDIEFLSAMDNNFNLVCDHYSIGQRRGVDLCPKAKDICKKEHLFFVIHNHPSNIPLQSEADVMSFLVCNIKYNIVFTEKNGIFLLKNNGANKQDIKMGWADTFQKMNEEYMKNNPNSYNEEYENYVYGLISRSELKKNLRRNTFKYVGENIDKGIEAFNEGMGKYNVEIIHILP